MGRSARDLRYLENRKEINPPLPSCISDKMTKIDDDFEKFEQEIFDTLMERNPHFATHLGIHKYDHKLPDGSKQKHLGDIEMMKDALKELKGFGDEELSEDNRMAKKVGVHLIELLIFEDEELEQWKKSPSVPDIIGSSIFPLIKRDFAPFEERFEDIKKRVEGVPEFIEQSKTALTEPIRLWVDMAIESSERIPMLFKMVMMIAHEKGVEDEKLEGFEKAMDRADEALEGYVDWLTDKRVEAGDDFTIGEEKFEKLLKKRKIPYQQEEILDLGEKYLVECKEDMKKYADMIDEDKAIEEVLEDILSQTPDDFEEAKKWYEEGLQDAKNFVIDNDLCTIPENEEIEVTETPDYLRHIIPFAAYMGPAKFEEKRKGIYLVTRPSNEKAWENMAYWDVRNTTVHEGYPGHHLQLSAALTQNDVFVMFSHAIETIEGWAHYCEEMMKDHGFDDEPEARLLQNKDLVWRAARIIVDVKLSTGKMSFEDAVNFMKDEVGMRDEAAVAEVKRYTQHPGYQLSYLLGKHMIKDLREDVKEEMGDEFNEKFFHDTILYAGSLPLVYIRDLFDKDR